MDVVIVEYFVQMKTAVNKIEWNDNEVTTTTWQEI